VNLSFLSLQQPHAILTSTSKFQITSILVQFQSRGKVGDHRHHEMGLTTLKKMTMGTTDTERPCLVSALVGDATPVFPVDTARIVEIKATKRVAQRLQWTPKVVHHEQEILCAFTLGNRFTQIHARTAGSNWQIRSFGGFSAPIDRSALCTGDLST
jgi:hypothetical protein